MNIPNSLIKSRKSLTPPFFFLAPDGAKVRILFFEIRKGKENRLHRIRLVKTLNHYRQLRFIHLNEKVAKKMDKMITYDVYSGSDGKKEETLGK